MSAKCEEFDYEHEELFAKAERTFIVKAVIVFLLFLAIWAFLTLGSPKNSWAQELPDPVQLTLGEEFKTISLAYLGPVYKDRAEGKVAEYAQENGKELVGGPKIYAHFKQAYFDTLGKRAGDVNVILTFVGYGSLRFPAETTILVENKDGDKWIATSVFHLIYRDRPNGYLEPEVKEIGLGEDTTLNQPGPIDFAAENRSQYNGRYFSACDGIVPGCDAITFFALIPRLSVSDEREWPRRDRNPFMITLIPKGGA